MGSRHYGSLNGHLRSGEELAQEESSEEREDEKSIASSSSSEDDKTEDEGEVNIDEDDIVAEDVRVAQENSQDVATPIGAASKHSCGRIAAAVLSFSASSNSMTITSDVLSLDNVFPYKFILVKNALLAIACIFKDIEQWPLLGNAFMILDNTEEEEEEPDERVPEEDENKEEPDESVPEEDEEEPNGRVPKEDEDKGEPDESVSEEDEEEPKGRVPEEDEEEPDSKIGLGVAYGFYG
ncbi:uncharacterized protein LOC131234537 [Magnolia sinica]|uniref:uncharacterized protein LOC131234537 n=1 Tax=Magnolia sinica TaxID=86752 RepID=UPI002658F118|nr:uncharacterized protein LOC131234537 [Magnolia sinica]